MPRLLIVAAIALVVASGQATAKPATAQPYSCATVRFYYLLLGREQLEALAVKYGVTPAQRRAALACLRGL